MTSMTPKKDSHQGTVSNELLTLNSSTFLFFIARFVTQIESITDLMEMQATKFECQLAPVGDPSMKVEWFFNGRPLPFSKITLEFDM